MLSDHQIILMISGIGLLGFVCQWLSWWIRLPAILLLLVMGLIGGPVLDLIQPDVLFGELLFPVVSLAVAIILFEGSLTLKFEEIRGMGSVVWRLATVGLFVTGALTALACYYVIGLELPLCLLFGAMTAVTGPTVIVPLVRTVRPDGDIANILRWEGILIDPLGALLAVIVFQCIELILPSSVIRVDQEGMFFYGLWVFSKFILAGLAAGLIPAFILAEILKRHLLPEYLHAMAVLTIVLAAFALGDHLQSEAGLLAVTVLGVTLANVRGIKVDHILNFKENLTVLLISGLFLVLAARVDLTEFAAFGWKPLILLVFIQFVVRPVAVLLSAIPSSLGWRQRVFLAWIAPRGIIAAAISSLFALRLTEAGMSSAFLLVPLTFMVIIGTVVFQSITARPLARLLGVTEPEPKGFLIIGANKVARTIGEALKARGYRALLADSNWDHISESRMLGLDTYYGNPVSSHAEQYMNLIGIGHMLGLTPQRHLSVLSAMHFKSEFGNEKIFTVNTNLDVDSSLGAKHSAGQGHRGHELFGDDITYHKLEGMINRGAEIKTTGLTESYTYEDYKEAHKGIKTIPLFYEDENGYIRVVHAGSNGEPKAGSTIFSLVESSGKA